MDAAEKREKMKQIRDEVMNLTTSPLYEYRVANGYCPVLGEGSHDAEIMFVGEAPGRNEAEQGRPFCGAAGKILDELLASAGIPRESVYITNILKDRPPENRDPLPSEIEAYGPFLDRQIDVIRPKIIVALGRYAMGYLMRKYNLGHELGTITTLHGKVFDVPSLFGSMKLITLYHPAAAIYTASLKETLLEDFKALKRALASAA